MTDTIGYSGICSMLQGAVAQIRTHHEMLSRLDAAVGDGDHGTTILRTMEAVSKAASETAATDLKTFFAKVAWDVMSCDGGSTGPLLGSFFMGLSEGANGRETLDCAGFVTMMTSGVTKLQKQSKAAVGDKTMMDAFLPAVESLKQADPAKGIKSALENAALAAAAGAEATRAMRAKFGRARNLGDRVIGHPDPGAVSVSLIFKGFSEGV